MQNRMTKNLIYLLLTFASLYSVFGFAETGLKPLPVEQAFKFSATFDASNKMMAQWNIAPGYYLYQQKLHINMQPSAQTEITYPQGQRQFNDTRGHVNAYVGMITVPVLLHNANKQLRMSVDYQGCSEGGFCYPPMHKEFNVDVSAQTIKDISALPDEKASTNADEKLTTLATDQNKVDTLLANASFGMLMLVFAGLGLLLAFTPCVLPMIPILTGIILGQRQPLTTGKAFLLSLAYVMGAAITYSLAGVAAAMMGSSLQAWLQQPWVIVAVSILFVILALSLFGLFDIRLPRMWQHHITAVSRKQQSGTYPGAFIMGMVSTLIVSPCVTAPLVGVLMYIGQTGDILLGAAALFAMGIGMGIPLLLIGVSARKFLPKSGPWMVVVKQLFGVMMLVMAVWMFSRIPSLDILHSERNTATEGSFVVVQNLKQVNQQLLLAQEQHKPVILDFYADWCESCVSMDKKVFSSPSVRAALSNFVLLRADLTANNQADDQILKSYAVVAPPTVLFFNDKGKEINSRRIVGEVSPGEFLGRINTFMSARCDKKLQC